MNSNEAGQVSKSADRIAMEVEVARIRKAAPRASKKAVRVAVVDTFAVQWGMANDEVEKVFDREFPEGALKPGAAKLDSRNVLSLRPGGTPNIAGWRLGERVSALADVDVGMVLLNVEDQFGSQNLVRITRVGNDIVGRDQIAYGVFADPANVEQKRVSSDHEFSIWDWELVSKSQAFYRVTRIEH